MICRFGVAFWVGSLLTASLFLYIWIIYLLYER